MSWPDIVRGVQERITDCAAQDRELAALAQEELMVSDRSEEALRTIYAIASRVICDPDCSETSALLEILSIIDDLRGR